FELQLFASEPDVVNPIYMNWDERGRLWVIETVNYPNEIKEEDVGDDRIKILEDTDGDGKADKFTVFADRLNIPTSFVFSNGGIIVSAAPSFLFLKDTTGDDRADIKQSLLNGWGKWDTHAQASNLRYGFDNTIWGVVGYSGFKGKMGNDSLKFGQGIYRFTPDGKMLDFLSTTSNNTWGLGFSEENDVFVSTANNTHSAFFGIPKKYLDKANIKESGVEKIDAHYSMHVATKNLRQVDVHGGFTAASGHSLYTGRTFPKEYWNRVAFVNEPTGRLVHKNILRQEGSGFKEDGDGWNMLASADEWAAPIQAEPGPDGALWIVDWYDFIIQHNPTPTPERGGYAAENGKGNAYINPLRDHERGRIYRIAYKNNDERSTLQLNKKDVPGLINALSNKNMFWRMTAQRLLVERGDQSVLPALYKLVENEAVDEIGTNAAAIHALWTMHGLKALDGNNKMAIEAARKALHHTSGGVRRAAVQVLPKKGETLQTFVKENLFNDRDLRVRLAAVLATTEVKPTNQLGEILVTMTQKEENTNDVWIRQAVTIASKIHAATYKLAADKKGLNAPSTFATSSMVQRLAYGPRFSSTQLKTTSWQNANMNPEVALREIVVSGNIQKSNADYLGLLMAHGNKSNGYAVYFKEGKIYFLINSDGRQYSIHSTQPLPTVFALKASLEKNGRMRLFIDKKEVASVNKVPLFTNEFETTLRTALENKSGENRIGDFEKEFSFNGSFSNLRLETLAVDNLPADKVSKIDQTIVLKVVKDVMRFD
ncbi:MAG TPA: PVC-type heme-binding CxxCH protein, partial [Flavisolibacter sp.]|nr:PVC-type heme-binding CxxCH protein [Flavisolibacter sp.]